VLAHSSGLRAEFCNPETQGRDRVRRFTATKLRGRVPHNFRIGRAWRAAPAHEGPPLHLDG